jgi:uncharacterized protein YycO
MRVILVRSRSLGSVLIRARLWENWSHAAVLLQNGDIIDATFKAGGVRRRKLDDVLKHASDFRIITLPIPDPVAAASFLHAQIGKPYDWRAILGWATSDREWADDSAWFCFELVAAAAQAGGLHAWNDLKRVSGWQLEQAAQ